MKNKFWLSGLRMLIAMFFIVAGWQLIASTWFPGRTPGFAAIAVIGSIANGFIADWLIKPIYQDKRFRYFFIITSLASCNLVFVNG